MRIHPSDNVEVHDDGQKYALNAIPAGENVIKYGFPIGHAKRDIAAGEKIDPSNLRSNLSGLGAWEYVPFQLPEHTGKTATFKGYLRKNGDVGIRNELWIIPTVGCANGVAKKLAAATGARALTHPYGCSQLGGDQETTQKILRGLIRHPNAGGVLVLGLGCENNNLGVFRPLLGDVDPQRIRFLNLQDCTDEMDEGVEILENIKAVMAQDQRTDVPVSKLRVAVKCGGSDGYSGITANPLVGMVANRFDEHGSTILMSEIPEVFGAEQILLSRCDSRETFDKAAGMIQAFRQYFLDHGEGIADNPSPGNIAGGISTLEEKSLGCVQKAGYVPLRGALDFGEIPDCGGLHLVNGPGNDMVAVTSLAASGAQLILFTTGRGTPLCGPVPTLKIATNSALAQKKQHWIDFDAGVLLSGADREKTCQALFDLCIAAAEGQETRGEIGDYIDIAIFKNGVTL